jgi:hypothetical protein
MKSNQSAGFEAFQDQMLECAEACGGDPLADMWAEHLFAECLRSVMRTRPEIRHIRPYGFPGPHRGEWLRASEHDFALAAEIARDHWYVDIAGTRIPVGDFSIVHTSAGIWRSGPRGVITLMIRRGRDRQITDCGMALAQANGRNPRSKYQSYSTEQRAIDAIPGIAEFLFATKKGNP